MKPGTLLKVGVIGTIVTAICCFTPLLVVILGAIGLSSAVKLTDAVLLPLLGIFLIVTGYALWKRTRSR